MLRERQFTLFLPLFLLYAYYLSAVVSSVEMMAESVGKHTFHPQTCLPFSSCVYFGKFLLCERVSQVRYHKNSSRSVLCLFLCVSLNSFFFSPLLSLLTYTCVSIAHFGWMACPPIEMILLFIELFARAPCVLRMHFSLFVNKICETFICVVNFPSHIWNLFTFYGVKFFLNVKYLVALNTFFFLLLFKTT